MSILTENRYLSIIIHAICQVLVIRTEINFNNIIVVCDFTYLEDIASSAVDSHFIANYTSCCMHVDSHIEVTYFK